MLIPNSKLPTPKESRSYLLGETPGKWLADAPSSQIVRTAALGSWQLEVGSCRSVQPWADVRNLPHPTDNPVLRRTSNGCATDLERFPENQSGQHPGAGVSRHRFGGDDQLQPAARRVSDAHPAEALVPDLRARSAHVGDRQGLRVREGPLRRDERGGRLQGPP